MYSMFTTEGPQACHGTFSKQDVADLLDEHYLRLTEHIEALFRRLPFPDSSAESIVPTGIQGIDKMRSASVAFQPAPEQRPTVCDVLADPKDEGVTVSPRAQLEALAKAIGDRHSVNDPEEDPQKELEAEVHSLDEDSEWDAKDKPFTESYRDSMLKTVIEEIVSVQQWSLSKITLEGIAALINIVNAALVGVRIEYESKEGDSSTGLHTALDIGTAVFCVFFVCELLHRLYVQRMKFFTGSEWAWNGFEILISLSMIVDEILRRITPKFTERFNIGWLSAFRIITLLKHHSVLQSMPFWYKLNRLLSILERCSSAVVCPVIIILLMTYLLALALTQRTAEFCVAESLGKDLCKYFGGLEASIFSLLAAVLGGLPWGLLLDEFRNLGVFYTTIFVLFVAMTSLVLLNTLLSAVMMIYQQFAGSKVADDIKMQIRRQREFIEKAMHFFEAVDADFNGSVSEEEFRFAMKDERLLALLDSMKVEVSDVDGTFELLDSDGSGFIDLNELIEGLVRISGTARGVDLVKLSNQFERMKQTMETIRRSLHHEDDIVRPVKNSKLQHLPSRTSFGKDFSRLRKQVIAEMHKANPSSESRITQVQHRAMSLKELRAVRQTVELLCPDEQWVDTKTRAKLSPADVNLYTFNHHFICPATLPNGLVFRNVDDLQFFPGQEVIQYDENGFEQANGEVIDTFEMFGQECFRLLVNTGRFAEGIPITVGEQSCQEFRIDPPTHVSYKELVASKPLSPQWFCSHWWGERIFDFVACIESHVKLHQYQTEATGYWICAYANDQHDLGLEIGGEVEDTSFFKAMKISKGVLVILDPAATAFTRIWCDFEIYKAIQDGKELDVVTVRQRSAGKAHEPRPCMLTQNLCPGETSRHKQQRELCFPLKILSRGMSVQLENGDATQQSDIQAILDIMAEGHSPTSPEFVATMKLANATLHSYFAQAAWPSAVKRNNVEDFDPRKSGTLHLPSILVQDRARKHLCFNFSNLDVLSDLDLKLLGAGLPPQLESLDLDFSNCVCITDRGVMHLALKLKEQYSLRKMILNFSSCVLITDKGVLALAEGLPPNLSKLQLHFLACQKLSPLSGKAIATNIGDSSVKDFSATFKGSLLNQDFESLKDLKRWIKKEKIPVRFTVRATTAQRVTRTSTDSSRGTTPALRSTFTFVSSSSSN